MQGSEDLCLYMPKMGGVSLCKAYSKSSKPLGRTLMTMVFAWMCVDVTKDDRAVHSHILDFPFFGIIMLHLENILSSFWNMSSAVQEKKLTFLQIYYERFLLSSMISLFFPFLTFNTLARMLQTENNSPTAPLVGALACTSFLLS